MWSRHDFRWMRDTVRRAYDDRQLRRRAMGATGAEDGSRMSENVMESRAAFRRSVKVRTRIAAPPSVVWDLLTNVDDIPRWNSTVSTMSGHVAPGGRIRLTVPTSTRTFNLTVDTCTPPSRLVLSEGNAIFRGVRTYTLTQEASGSTGFEMEEVLTGLMLPLIARSLPDFKPVFARYVADLTQEAERR